MSKKKKIKSRGNQIKRKPKAPQQHKPVKSPLIDFLTGKGGYIALILLAIVGFVVFKDYLLFENAYVFKDIGSDSLNSFYPLHVLISDYIREFGFPPTWTFRWGVGQNVLPGTVGDPFNWLMYSKGGSDLAYVIGYSEYLKVLSAGMIFFAFLRVLKLNVYTAVVGAIFYGFTGFLIIGSGWYIFSSEAVFAALLFLAFELYYSRQNWYLLPIAVCLIGSYVSYNFIPYAILIFCYSIFRFVGDNDWDVKKYLGLMSSVLMWALLGVGISALFSVSGIVQMLNSPRVSGDASFFADLSGKFDFESSRHYFTALLKTFSNDILGTGSRFTGWSNFLEAPSFYCGLSSLLLAPQVFSFLDKKKKILFAILTIMFIAPIIFPVLRYAYWLFAGDYYRGFSLVVSASMMFLALNALHHITERGRVGRILLLVSLILLLLLLFMSAPAPIQVDTTIRNAAATFLILEAALIFGMSFPNLKGLMQVGLLLLICVEAGYMSHKTVNDRDTLTAQDLESKIGYNDYTIEALDYIKSIDNGFYRVEKNYNSGLAIHSSINDALIQDFKSTGSYHSFNNKYYVDFLSSVGLLDATNENATRWIRGVKNRPLLMVLMHTKYYLAKSDQFQLYGFNKIHQVGDVSIFKNSFFVDFGIAMDQYMARDKFEALASITQKDISLMRSFVLEKDQIARYKDELTEFDPSNIGESYSSENMSQDIASHLDENLKVVDFKDYRIKGSIQVDKPKMLFVSTAFDKGWSATVNGQSVEVERVNIGFTGVMLQAGENEVVLTYRPPFYRLSLILTLACLIFYGFLILRSRRPMKKRSVAPES